MEWMFAARGGNSAPYPAHNPYYSGSNDIDAVAWYQDNSDSTTHEVGTKDPNELGLYDLSGNVWEWTWDIFDSYPSGSQTNPTGANSGSKRVVRGGSWGSVANYCTVSIRYNYRATGSSSIIGFRCVSVSP
jgi:formylglycine-generating enzyme required for sulfatase activity